MEGRKLMPTIDNLEWTFDKVPELYAKIRPSYPTELYESIFDYLNVDDNSKLIEIATARPGAKCVSAPSPTSS